MTANSSTIADYHSPVVTIRLGFAVGRTGWPILDKLATKLHFLLSFLRLEPTVQPIFASKSLPSSSLLPCWSEFGDFAYQALFL